MRIGMTAALAAMTLAGSARAAVVETWDGGFRIENKASVTASPDQAWQALSEVGRWWNSAHTYSGSASNMFIEMKPGGCWCEALPGGGVEHGRVVLVLPQQRTLRIDGALGPLQGEGVSAALTWAITPTPGGSEIVQTYIVGGARPDTVKFAQAVDGVMAEQLSGLQAYLQPTAP